MIKGRIYYVLTLVITIVLLLFYHNYFFFVLLEGVLILPVFSGYATHKVMQHLDVTAVVEPQMLQEKESFTVRFRVHNPVWFPLPQVKLYFHVENLFYPNAEQQIMALPVYAGKMREYTWNCRSSYAGRVVVKMQKQEVQDPLHLFMFTKSEEQEVYTDVVPEPLKIVRDFFEKWFQDSPYAQQISGLTGQDVSEVRDFREFQPGDRLQQIHWKMSARQEELYVKEYEQMAEDTLCLLIELKKSSQEIGFLNQLLRVFYSFAKSLLGYQTEFYVQWYDKQNVQLVQKLITSEEKLLQIMQLLYQMQSYEQRYEAYVAYKVQEKKVTTCYFAPYDFPNQKEDEVIGTVEDKVMVLCLH